MPSGITITGARRMTAAFQRAPGVLEVETARAVRSAGRILAREYGAATNPPDLGGASAAEKFGNRIKKDVAQVYPARENTAGVYRLFLSIDPTAAKAWYHKFKSGKLRAAADMLRAAGLPEATMSAAQLKAFRTGRGGRVRGGQVPAGITRISEQRRFSRGQIRLIGTAKAGWLQAAQAIGGRVRRGGIEAFPAYVRAASRLHQGLGGAWVGKQSVSVWTNVRHARGALKPSLQATAESLATDYFNKSLEAALQAMTNRISTTRMTA